MKIELDKIEIGEYDVREEKPEEHIKELKESLKNEGQINPIIVKPENNHYTVVSGHSRLRAARELGWDEVEAEVKDLDEEEADRLSLTSNMFRKEMSNLEQGKVLQKMIEKHDYSYNELADKIGKSSNWVRRRVKVALNVHEDVAEALEDGEINIEAAFHISSLDDEEKQKELLQRIIDKGITQAQDIREEKRWLQNDTIYTIGYSGKDFEEFIDILKKNDVDKVLDVRHSTDSQYKPNFNGEVLERQLKQEGIHYEHRKDLGVPYLWQTPYKEGVISDGCFANFYEWHIQENNEVELEELVSDIKDTGNVALLCMEAHAQSKGEQNHDCHRYYLAKMLKKTGFSQMKNL